MPVFGLPSALESSLNSLIDLRPPTSWRVSGHGRQEVTVVVRWTLHVCSPSSEKTLQYEEVDKVLPTAPPEGLVSASADDLAQENFPILMGKATAAAGNRGSNKPASLSQQSRHLKLLNRGDSQSSGCFSHDNPANFQDNVWVDPEINDCFPLAKKHRRLNNIPYRLYRNPSYGSSSTSSSYRRLSALQGRAAFRGNNISSKEIEKHRSAFRAAFSVNDSPNNHVSSASSAPLGSFENNDSQDVCSINVSFKENKMENTQSGMKSQATQAKSSCIKTYQHKPLSGFQHIEADTMATFKDGNNHPCHTPKPLYANSCGGLLPRDVPNSEAIMREAVSHSPSLQNDRRYNTIQPAITENGFLDANISPEVVIDVDDLNVTCHDGADADYFHHKQLHTTHTGHKKVHTQMKTLKQIVLPGSSTRQRPQEAEYSTDEDKKLRNGIRAYLAKCGSGDSSQVEICDLVDNDNDDDDDDNDNYSYSRNKGGNPFAKRDSDEFDGKQTIREEKLENLRLDERSGVLLSTGKSYEDVHVLSPQSPPHNESGINSQHVSNHPQLSFQKEYISTLEEQFKRCFSGHASVESDECQVNIDSKVGAIKNDSNRDTDRSSTPRDPIKEVEAEKDSNSPVSVTIDQHEDQGTMEEDNQRTIQASDTKQNGDSPDKILAKQDVFLDDCDGQTNPTSNGFEVKYEETSGEMINVDTDDIDNPNMTVSTSDSTYCQDELSYDSDQLPAEEEMANQEISLDRGDLQENNFEKSDAKEIARMITPDVNDLDTKDANEEEIREEESVITINVDHEGGNAKEDLPTHDMIEQEVREKLNEESEVSVEIDRADESEKEVKLDDRNSASAVTEPQHSTLINDQHPGSESSVKAINGTHTDDQCHVEVTDQCPVELSDQCPVEMSSEKEGRGESDSNSDSHYLIDLSPQKDDIDDSVHLLHKNNLGEERTIDESTESSSLIKRRESKCALKLDEGGDRIWNVNEVTETKNKVKVDINDKEVDSSESRLDRRLASVGETSFSQRDTLTTNNNEKFKKSPHRNRKRKHAHRYPSRSPSPYYSPKQTMNCAETEQVGDSPCIASTNLSNHSTRRKTKTLGRSEGVHTPPYDSPSKSTNRSSRRKTKSMKKSHRLSAHNSPNHSDNPSLYVQDHSNQTLSLTDSNPNSKNTYNKSKSDPGGDNSSKSPSLSSISRSPHEISSTWINERARHSPGKVMSDKGSRESSPSTSNTRQTNRTYDSKHSVKMSNKGHSTEEKEDRNESSFRINRTYDSKHSVKMSNKRHSTEEKEDRDESSFSVISRSPQVSLVRIEHSMHLAPKKRYRQESHDSDCPASRHYRKKDKRHSSKSPRHETLETSPYQRHDESDELPAKDTEVHHKKRSTAHFLHCSPQHEPQALAEEADANSRNHSYPEKSPRPSHHSSSLLSEAENPDWNSTCNSSLEYSPPAQHRHFSSENEAQIISGKRSDSESPKPFTRSCVHSSAVQDLGERLGSTLEAKTPENVREGKFDTSYAASSPPCPANDSPLGFACESFEHLPEGNDVKLDDSSSDEASIRPPTPLADE